MEKIYTVGIIGGGVSGVVTALQLANLEIDSILFEQEKSVVNGPPFCHLHAGGNLYPDISDEECRILMKQSIEMARLFPQSIDERPTFISIPKSENYEVAQITNRLEMLRDYYELLIRKDPLNKILGDPKEYYTIYTKEKLVSLRQQQTLKHPSSPDEWMINAMQLIDLEKLKMPVLIVQEYGWNLFRLGAQAQLALKKTNTCSLKLDTEIQQIKDVRDKKLAYNWELFTPSKTYRVKYLVNSCGYKTGNFDASLKLDSTRLIEFKAAYVSKWKPIQGLIPELIFHGKRGTNNGMAQLTPYGDNYYQIHGMTKDITLFENGLIESKTNVPQPEFNAAIKQKLNAGWQEEEAKTRTISAINFVSKFLPSFKTAIFGGAPFYGAQQIPGRNPDLRVGEVSFPSPSYARSEIIKASSALTVANQIIIQIQKEKIIPTIDRKKNQNPLLDSVSKNDIDRLASELAVQRGYPIPLSRLLIEK
jgi:hypothetical protein